MGSKINLFSNLPKKSFLGFYFVNNHIPTVLGRPFFTFFRLFSCRNGGCELVPQQIAQNSSFSENGAKWCKMCDF
jgi:hypothetical protein